MVANDADAGVGVVSAVAGAADVVGSLQRRDGRPCVSVASCVCFVHVRG